MGTRRKKRSTYHTRKKKGGALWTPNKERTVKRRQELLAFTSNSTRKSNIARQAVHNYLASVQEEENRNETIVNEDVLHAITPIGPVDLLGYIDYAKRKCESLIETAIQAMMQHKKRINEGRRQSKQATFLANRAAMRAQQAAHIASISRLSNSSIEPSVQAELNAWNKSALQRGLDQEENIKEAARIFQKKSTIEMEEIHLRYELTKQVAEQIEKLDYIIPLYQHYDVMYSSNKRDNDIKEIVKSARNMILTKIRSEYLNKAAFIDRAIPKLLEEIMIMLVNASAAYVKTVKGTALDVAKAYLQHLRIQEKQMQLNRLHFIILTRDNPKIRPEMAKTLVPDDVYREIERKIDEQQKEVERLETH